MKNTVENRLYEKIVGKLCFVYKTLTWRIMCVYWGWGRETNPNWYLLMTYISVFQSSGHIQVKLYLTFKHLNLMKIMNKECVVVQSLSRVRLFNPMDCVARQVPLSFTISRNLLKSMSVESVMLSNHLTLCLPLLLLPSVFASIRVFSNELSLHTRWPKYSIVITTIVLLD